MITVSTAKRTAAANKAKTIALEGHYYQYGGTGPGYDCSGLALAAWKGTVDLPHNTVAQAQFLAAVPANGQNYKKLLPGDLVFYYGENGIDEITHVAVYVEKFGSMLLVAQATKPGVLSELIRMKKYATPSHFGFVGHN